MTTTFHAVGEVETDARRRIPLASLKLSSDPNTRYRVEEGPDGELRLIPIFSISVKELALLRDSRSMERIEKNLADAEDAVDFDPKAALARLDELDAQDQ
jgi:hypothetical protein